MAHEADAASVVEHVFFQYGFALGAAARRGRCVDALGFFEPFRKIKTVGGDVGTIEVVLLAAKTPQNQYIQKSQLV